VKRLGAYQNFNGRKRNSLGKQSIWNKLKVLTSPKYMSNTMKLYQKNKISSMIKSNISQQDYILDK